jgi:hypothetical protein
VEGGGCGDLEESLRILSLMAKLLTQNLAEIWEDNITDLKIKNTGNVFIT